MSTPAATKSSSSTDHPSDQILSQFSVGDLDPLDRQRIEDHLAECEACLTRLDQGDLDDDLVSLARSSQQHSPPIEFGVATVSRQDQSLPQLTKSERYRLKNQIARGGMGEIWSAHDVLLNREVALKIVSTAPSPTASPNSHSANPNSHSANVDGQSANGRVQRVDAKRVASSDLVRRFEHESRVVAGLQHPGIPPVYDLGRLPDERPFLAMKLVDGHTLRECLSSRKNQTVEWLLEIFLQVCQTLAFAHDRGIVHRDLKPENIMVGEFGETQVMDWGIAESYLIDRFNATDDSVVGTPAYMSPEQALGLRCGPRSDVYSLGLILCEILLGVRGNRASSTIETLQRAMIGNDQQLNSLLRSAEIDERLADLASSCIEFEPTLRPEHAGDLAGRISDYLHSLQTRLHAAELEQAKQTTREKEQTRRRGMRWSIALLLGMMIATVGFASFQNHTRESNLLRLIDEAVLKATTLREAHFESEDLARLELESAIVAASQANSLADESQSAARIESTQLLVDQLSEDLHNVDLTERMLEALDHACLFESRVTIEQNFKRRMDHRQKKLNMGIFQTSLFLNKPSSRFASNGPTSLRPPLDPSAGRSTSATRPRRPLLPGSQTARDHEALKNDRAFAFFTDVFRFSATQRENYQTIFANFGIAPDMTTESAVNRVESLKPHAINQAVSGLRIWFLFAADTGDQSAIWIDKVLDLIDSRDDVVPEVAPEIAEWRKDARRAIMERDPVQIQSACDRGVASVDLQPEELVWGLGCFQRHFAESKDTSFLEIAQARFTSSYLINRELASRQSQRPSTDEKLPYLMTALAIVPDQPLLLALARKRLQQGRLDEFYILRDRSFRASENDKLILFEWADAMAMSRVIPRPEAILVYEKAIEQGFQFRHLANARIGQLYFEMGELRLSRQYLLRASCDPGLSTKEADELKVAIEKVNQLISQKPQDV